VLNVAGGPVGTAYYDVPDTPGFDARQLWVPWNEVRELTEPYSLEERDRERQSAQHLFDRSPNAVVRAIAAARLLAFQRELDGIDQRFDALHLQSVLLSGTVREALGKRQGRFTMFRSTRGTTAEAEARASEHLAPLGLEVDEVLLAERPLITADEYVRWFTPRQIGSVTPAAFLARAVRLRRFPNPEFEGSRQASMKHMPITCVDRVEALMYAADKVQGRLAPFLAQGHRLLGTAFRDARLPRLLLDDPVYRRIALAALVLLGDAGAEEAALRLLHNPSGSVEDCIAALHALLVLRRVTPPEWPERVQHPVEQRLLRARTDVLLAAHYGRWLLQR
jgi:hypothetical protein